MSTKKRNGYGLDNLILSGADVWYLRHSMVIVETQETFGQVLNVFKIWFHELSTPHENHTRNFKAFLNALESGEEFWIDGREARKAVEVILAVNESTKDQKLVKLKKTFDSSFSTRS